MEAHESLYGSTCSRTQGLTLILHSTRQETQVLELAARTGCLYSALPDDEHLDDCAVFVSGTLQQLRAFYEAGEAVDLW